MSRPTLAVLVTYYNEGELLYECVRSIFAQEAPPDEVLVYDDASRVPAASFVPADLPVRIIRGAENVGPGAGRNALLREATAEYVHFQDADDLLDPAWAGAVRAAIGAGGPDIVFTEIRSERNGRVVSPRVMGIGGIAKGGDLVTFGLLGALLVPSSTFRRALGLRIGGFRPREVLAQSEDFDFHVRLAAAASEWRVVESPLVVQRLRDGSHSADQRDVWMSSARAISHLAGELDLRYRPALAEAAARAGARLYQIGARAEAREAFLLARCLGGARYPTRPTSYRFVARTLGPEAAEWVGATLRRAKETITRWRNRSS